MLVCDQYLPGHSTTDEVLRTVRWMCDAGHLHGVMVQLPLPAHIDEAAVLREIDARKDVDGLSPMSIGAMMTAAAPQEGPGAGFRQCTPIGCAELLREYGVSVEGKRVVVVGTSNTAGTPLGMHLRDLGALSVTMCRVPDARDESREAAVAAVKAISRGADVLAVMVGQAELVTADWVKPGAVVLDVDINTVRSAAEKRGFAVVGDVHYAGVAAVASHISPVPGGAGPMTVGALLANVLVAARRSLPQPPSRPA